MIFLAYFIFYFTSGSASKCRRNEYENMIVCYLATLFRINCGRTNIAGGLEVGKNALPNFVALHGKLILLPGGLKYTCLPLLILE
jgi:hypothetical protein